MSGLAARHGIIWQVTASPPSVSVVIPARDSVTTLPATLDSIHSQDYPRVVDVVVAVAGSAPDDVPAGVTIVENQDGSTPAGLNAAIAASSGEVIVRCDAHAVLPPGYISRAVDSLERSRAANVGGMQVPIGGSFWQSAIAAAMSSRLGAGDAKYRIGGEEGPAETVYLGVFRRDALERVGGFNEDFPRNQDFELNHRLIEADETVWFDPELRVGYAPRDSLGALARQYSDYGKSKRHFSRVYPGRLRKRQLAAPLLVIALAAALIVGFWWAPAWWIAAGYPAALFGAGLFSISGWGLPAIGMPFALATMHFSWGFGFLRG